jgi:hypothetical protein
MRRAPVFFLMLLASSAEPLAHAQPDDALAEARKRFAEAVADEDASRYETALEKFRQVEGVKDTANVRYRIATCLEALGRRAEALSNYQTAVRLAETEKTAAEVGRESAARAGQLDRILPHLSVVIPPDAPPETRVRVDDAAIDTDALKSPIPLDPGMHTIAADAPGRVPYRTGVKLPEGGTVAISLALDRPGATGTGDTANPGAGGLSLNGASSGSGTSPGSEQPPPPHGGPPAGALVLLGLGGALAVGSIVSFALQESNLSTMNSDCTPPSGVTPASGMLWCPRAKQNEVDSAHSAASVEGPLGWGLGIGAVAALGTGVWFLVRPRPATQATGGVQVMPLVSRAGGMLVVSGPLPQ